jgi:membrane-anchored protein YejM (alkaline phosphatase superfamily)
LPSAGKALWSAGFLPSLHQGVEFRAAGDPVLYLQDPPGYDRARRERSLRAMVDLQREHEQALGDPETTTRIAQYELAFRMQMSVPEAVALDQEPAEVHALYGTTPGQASFANNCLLARRLCERGVRFVQLFDSGWDIHGTGPGDDLMTQFPSKAAQIDRALAALLIDLRRRGLLDETLVVWGGEFGRTPMNEARDGSKFLGRDHHPHCFSMLLAGGGTKRGAVVGATDELGARVVDTPIHVHDLQATILHLLGVDHERLTHKFQGRQFRLTDVHGVVRRELLA